MQGGFAFSSDLHADGMLWGRTLRSPHPHARIVSIDVGPALAIPGVSCVVTADDVPGSATYGLISADQPVFARDVVRFVGEPVAVVAADHPDTARLALAAIAVAYEPLVPLVDAEAAAEAAPIHPEGNVIRRIVVDHGDAGARGDVVVEGTYEVGMQDQAFLGPESGLAVPDGEGGVDLWVATQWLHEDRDQVAACLGLPPERVRLHLGGVGGAFGGREDVSMQVHACLLALAADRPVKMSYLRDESFLGHVHRHPALMRYRHHATWRGDLVKVEAELLLDGGAYASSSAAVVANAARFACGPYRVPNATIDAVVVRTNNPPCGAMRGFGAVQVCFGHESQMDRLAARLGIDPVELRLRNALGPGDVLPTGQAITGTAPVAECIRAAVAHPLPPPAGEGLLERPGGVGRTDDPPADPAGRRGRGGVQEPAVQRGLRRHVGGAGAAGRRRRHRHLRGGGGRPGVRDDRRPDRPDDAGLRRRGRRAGRHVDGGVGGVVVGLAADVDVGRRRAAGVPAGRRPGPLGAGPEPRGRARRAWWRPTTAASSGRRAGGRRPGGRGRGDRGVRGVGRPPPPAHRAARRPGPGRRPTSATCSPPTAPWSTSTPTSGWCGSCRWRPARTSAGCCTRPR